MQRKRIISPASGLWPAVVLAIILGGCVTTQERYDKAVRLEGEGRYVEAVDYYARVLEKEPAWAEARRGLEEAGTRAVADYLAAAQAAEAQGRYAEAVRQLRRLDRLRAKAGRAGVDLAVPDDYADYRDEMTDVAVADALRAGEAAEAAGEWRAALERYDEVLEEYELSASVREEIDGRRARVFVRWGEREMERGHFRAAYDRAAHALRAAGPEAPLGRLALELQDEALHAGTRYVAFLPFGGSEAALREAPRGLLRRLDDVLGYDYWRETPLFLAPVDPAETYRALRTLPRGPLSTHDAAALGRRVEADLVVMLDLTGFTWKEVDREEERRTARTRGRNPVDTTYTVERYRAVVDGEAEYRIVDARTHFVVDRGHVRVDVSEGFERGRYAGDVVGLDLSRRERAWFDREALAEEERALEDAFVDALAEEAARRVFEAALGQVP